SHALAGNVDWHLLARIAVPGMLGGIAGAWLLSSFNPALARPVVFAYLAILSVYIIARAARARAMTLRPKVVEPVGAAGGFLDAIGGGGWGPVVTSNLLAQGSQPRQTIGTVNLAEFFVTSAISGAFFVALDEEFLSAPILGLVLGGVIAAPIGALLVRRVPARPLMAAVGLILLLTSGYGLWKALA
ncbi:MAG: sulfite exporter TauE/SafE family protein, partial [Sphingomonadaceae bacterium]